MYLKLVLVLFCIIYDTNAQTYVICPASVTVCQNGGVCVVSNGRDIQCICPNGFKGDFYI